MRAFASLRELGSQVMRDVLKDVVGREMVVDTSSCRKVRECLLQQHKVLRDEQDVLALQVTPCMGALLLRLSQSSQMLQARHAALSRRRAAPCRTLCTHDAAPRRRIADKGAVSCGWLGAQAAAHKMLTLILLYSSVYETKRQVTAKLKKEHAEKSQAAEAFFNVRLAEANQRCEAVRRSLLTEVRKVAEAREQLANAEAAERAVLEARQLTDAELSAARATVGVLETTLLARAEALEAAKSYGEEQAAQARKLALEAKKLRVKLPPPRTPWHRPQAHHTAAPLAVAGGARR
jgi:hypothetical protein